MSKPDIAAERAARVTTFATLGTLGTTQEVIRVAISGLSGADPELVAEETLTFVGLATARAAEVGLKEQPDVARPVVSALYDLPFLYRDYLIGGSVIMEMDESLLDDAEVIYQRLQRKREFYSAHLPSGKFPGEHTLRDKMGLWMGRISPPSQPDMPDERLERLDIVPTVLTHLKLVLAFGRRSAEV
jgi:hypothetical protein